MIEYLVKLEQEGVIVHRNGQITSSEEFNEVSSIVSNYLGRYKDINNYVLSPDDLVFNKNCNDIFNVWKYLLDKFTNLNVVSSNLDIYDIPDSYMRKKEVFCYHEDRFQKADVNIDIYNRKEIKFIYAGVDMFGMYRRDFIFKRMNSGIRTCEPYTVKHLPWYIDFNNMSYDETYYRMTASGVLSNW